MVVEGEDTLGRPALCFPRARALPCPALDRLALRFPRAALPCPPLPLFLLPQMFRAFFLLALLARSAAAAPIAISGLRQPTSMALDAATGAVFISEQAGLIKRSCLNCSSAVVVKDITAQVYSFGCAYAPSRSPCALSPRARPPSLLTCPPARALAPRTLTPTHPASPSLPPSLPPSSAQGTA